MPAIYTQTVTVWLASFSTLTTDDEVPLAATLVTPPGTAGLRCNIHEGIKEAEDMTYALGVLNTTSAFAYMSPENGALIPLRAILLDTIHIDQYGFHKAWMVRHTITRDRFPATRHTRLLLTLLTVRPDGLPS